MAMKPFDKYLKLYKLKSWLRTSGFSLLAGAWKNNTDVLYCMFLSSLLINLLGLVFPMALLQVYDRIIRYHSTSTLIWLMILVFCSLILSGFLKIARAYISTWADAKFEHTLGREAFSSLLHSKLSLYEREGSGRHLKRITSLGSLRQFYASQALTTLVDVPFIFLYLLLIGYIAKWLVLVPIVVIIILFITTSRNTSFFQKKLRERQDHDERRLNFIIETISKIHTIKSNAMEAQMLRRFERLQKTSSLFDYGITQGSAALVSDSMVFSQIAVILITGLGSIMVFNGELSVGVLAACVLLVGQCLQPVNSLISMWGRLQIIKLAHKELNKILHMIPEDSGSPFVLNEIRGKIEFKNVSFHHQGQDFYVLNSINLAVEPGESISISGEKFSGKSTILSLILKLIVPDKGAIFIDGKNLGLLDPQSVRSHIGYMPDQAVMFKGTIMQNLTMFRDEYEVNARSLSRQVGLENYIEHFPDGYDTKVGYQATETLPRGLMQLIVIIRALVVNPEIILFDEANMNIDMAGDVKIIELLKELSKNSTMILISHRPSVRALAHKHYILENGGLTLVNETSKGV